MGGGRGRGVEVVVDQCSEQWERRSELYLADRSFVFASFEPSAILVIQSDQKYSDRASIFSLFVSGTSGATKTRAGKEWGCRGNPTSTAGAQVVVGREAVGVSIFYKYWCQLLILILDVIQNY